MCVCVCLRECCRVSWNDVDIWSSTLKAVPGLSLNWSWFVNYFIQDIISTPSFNVQSTWVHRSEPLHDFSKSDSQSVKKPAFTNTSEKTMNPNMRLGSELLSSCGATDEKNLWIIWEVCKISRWSRRISSIVESIQHRTCLCMRVNNLRILDLGTGIHVSQWLCLCKEDGKPAHGEGPPLFQNYKIGDVRSAIGD